MRSILKFSIHTDSVDNGLRQRKVYIDIHLYREDGAYVWRTGGPLGDEVETLPRPETVKQAMQDVLSVYGKSAYWDMRHNWKV